jgi:glycosyltransferase involved in cell wall biosynthesis/2-polyprenyl-3-methyl-5-hydroxy-6-metoxy-1,4-benzoquinol methylase
MSKKTYTTQRQWAATDAEAFWKACYAHDLEASRWPSKSAQLIASLLTRRFPEPCRVLLVGDRDPGLADALLEAGYFVARADVGPWLNRSMIDIETHERWLGSTPDVSQHSFDIVISVGMLECLGDDEVEPFLETMRCALANGGHAILVVPNGERLEQFEAVCPKTGVMFHSGQRVRAFNRTSLRALLGQIHLAAVCELEVEFDERILVEHAGRDPGFATASHAFIGAGTTLIAIARSAVASDRSDAAAALGRANAWLQSRRQLATSVSTPKADRWTWTAPSVKQFWSRITGTALDDLSFGKVLGRTLLSGVEPWLTAGGRHLDVGAGEGHMAEVLAASGYDVAVLEPAEGRAEGIEARLKGSAGFLGRLSELDDVHKGSFDVVLACEVIEHVLEEDLDAFFALLADALKPGGRIILSTPNAEDLSRSVVYSPFGNVLFHRWQHVRGLSAADLDTLLRRHGFEPDVLHEVDLAAAQREDVPLLEEILGSSRRRRHGRAENLIAIAHRAGQPAAQPRQLSTSDRRVARTAGRAGNVQDSTLSIYPALRIPGRRTYETIELAVTGAEPVEGHSFRLHLPNHFVLGDNAESDSRSCLRLFEDGRELGPAYALHADIAKLGRARFSHWGRELLFSSSDGTDPTSNGRNYVAVAEVTPVRTVNLDERLRAGDAPMLIWELAADAIQLTDGNLCSVTLPRTFPVGDDEVHPTRSTLELFEDGLQLGPAHALHEEIRSLGQGRFSHWQRSLLFSASDGQDPRHNGRRYVAVVETAPISTVLLDDYLRTDEAPTLVWELPADAIQLADGNLCSVTLPRTFPVGDDEVHPTRSTLELFEDGLQLGPAHALHEEIRSLGQGRFSHWQRSLLFSTSDGQDPRHNGRRYVVAARFPADSSNWKLRRVVRRVASWTVSAALPVARAALPIGVKARLLKPALTIERVLAGRGTTSFIERPVRLANFQPALPRSAFANGPVVLCNNALAWGGVERQVVNTLRGLVDELQRPPQLLCVRLGHDQDYDFYKSALSDFSGDVRNTVDLKISRRHLAAVEPGLEQRIADATAWLPVDVQEEILRFAGDFAALRPSIVHVWQDALSISAGFAARMIGVPRIIVSSRNMAAKRFAYYRPYMADGYRELASCADIVMLNNSEAGARDYAEWLGIPVDRYRIVRNGIDATEISSPADDEARKLRASLGLMKDTPVVGSIFRFYAEKRPGLWIETAARIAAKRPDCQFVIFGKGPMKDDVLAFAREHGFADRLHLPGPIGSAALGLSIMDLFLLTSEFEGTPNVVLEASLMGVPVVASDAGGTRETIEEGVTGFITDSADPDVLANHVVAALGDAAWRRRAREAGPKFVLTRFGLDRMLAETLDVYGLRE